jgi:serine phosphatase RsbU (regulator of sigma subunit)
MALMLVSTHKNKMTAVLAGMPHIFIYRQQDHHVDEQVLKGMPLGGSLPFNYQPAETSLAAGDTVLLISDGFPELFNKEKETLDYARARSIFAEIAGDAPEEIISHLNESAEKWRNGHPQADDMTFIVLKVKEG